MRLRSGASTAVWTCFVFIALWSVDVGSGRPVGEHFGVLADDSAPAVVVDEAAVDGSSGSTNGETNTYSTEASVESIPDNQGGDTTEETDGVERRSADLKRFEKWLRKHGGRMHKAVRFEHYWDSTARDVRVRAMMFRKHIDADSELVAVPESLLIHPVTREEGGGGWDRFDDHERLVLRLLEERARGRKSQWAPYLKLLPRPETSTSAYFFGQPELDALRGTYVATVIADLHARLDDFAARAAAWAAATRRDVADFDLEGLRWASAMVRSRAFSIKKTSNEAHPLNMRPFLAPGADFLNHDVDAFVAWRLGESKNGAFQVFTREDLAGGARREVFNNYQKFGNTMLLAHYGFVVDGNAFDSLPLRIQPPQSGSEELDARRGALLARLGLGEAQELSRRGCSVALRNRVRVIAAGEEQLAALEQRAAEGVDADAEALAVTADTEVRAADLLRTSLRRLLGGFTTDAADDAALLADDALPPRVALAVRGRAAEREVLSACVEELEDVATGNLDGDTADDAGAADAEL